MNSNLKTKALSSQITENNKPFASMAETYELKTFIFVSEDGSSLTSSRRQPATRPGRTSA